jgi:hypothetical protein
MSVIVDVIINTDQAEQQLQDLQQQIANDLAQGAARIGTTAGQAATATARAAGKNATEEFLRAFDPDKLKAELESAGLDEQQIEIILETTAAKAETQKLKDSIASAFGEASGFATDALKQITAQAAREVDRAAGKVKSVTEIVDGVRDLKDELKQVGGASDVAAEGIGQLVLNETVDKFGDLKDIFEKTGTALFGLSESAVEAGVLMGDIAEKGAAIGAAFGPTGAAIGLVAGGILGAFTASAKAAAEEAKKLTEEIASQKGVLESLRAEIAKSGDDLNTLTRLQEKLTEAQAKAAETEAARQAAAARASEALDAQVAAQARLSTSMDQGEKSSLLFLSASRKAEAARKDLAAAENALAAATKLSNEQQALAAELSFKLAAATYKEIKTIEDQYDVLVNGSKLSKKSAAELRKEYDDLRDTFERNKQWTDKLAQSSFDAKKTEAQLTAGLEDQKEVLKDLEAVKAELERRELKSTAATKSSTKATKDKTEAEKTALKMAEEAAAAAEHQAKVEEIVAKIETDRERKTYEYQRMLREQSMKDAAAANELAIKQAEELAKAQAETAKATVEAYKQILQPYADFVGSVFNSFVNGIAEGQSATEAFAKGVQQAVASALAALAKEFGVKSLGALAEGFAALSNPFTAAAAPGFFKSAALYAAAAAAAGAGSAFVSSAGGGAGGSVPNVGGGAGISSSAGGVGGTGNSLGGSSQQSNGTPGSIVVDLRGAVFPTNDLTGAQQFGEAVARSLAAASAGNQPMARRLIGTRGFVV